MNKFYLAVCCVLGSFSSVLAQAPADENFSDDASTGFNNLAQTLTNDGVTYFQDGVLMDGHYVEILTQDQYGLNFPPGSKALVYNVGQASGGTHYGFRSQGGAEFRLATLVIDVIGNAGGAGFATSYTIRGYRNNTQQVEQTVNFAASGTYGTITYALNAGYYTGGSLSFSASAEWRNIDEIRLYWNNNGGMIGAIKSIDFEPAITTPLPVVLLEYQATLRRDGTVDLRWSTAQENNNRHFEIERSNNGIQFQSIGRVEGMGTQARRTNYSFIDAHPLPGNNFYRLVQYDLDGTHKAYPVQTIRIDARSSVTVYPNPLPSHGFTLRLHKPVDSPVQYSIYTISGTLIQQGMVRQQEQFIPLTKPLNRGAYLLTLGDGTTVQLSCP